MKKTNNVAVILRTDSNELEINNDFPCDLESLQKVVGGCVGAFDIAEMSEGRRITIWFHDEGKMIGLTPNLAVKANTELVDIVMGDIVITSTDDEGETVGLNEEELNEVKERIDFNHMVLSPIFVERTLFI